MTMVVRGCGRRICWDDWNVEEGARAASAARRTWGRSALDLSLRCLPGCQRVLPGNHTSDTVGEMLGDGYILLLISEGWFKNTGASVKNIHLV